MKYWTTLQKLMWLKRASGGSQEYSGDIVTFDTAKAKKLKNLIVSLSPIQDLNGYDAPWPGGGGVNKCPISEHPNNPNTYWGSNWKDLVTVLNALSEGTYTISNKYKVVTVPSDNKVMHGNFLIKETVNGTTTYITPYSVQTDNSPTVGKVYEESTSFTITAENKGNISACCFFCDGPVHTGTGRGTYNLYDVQIEIGSTAHDWQPYSNLCPIYGRTGAGAYLGAEHDPDTATLYSVDWTDEAGTVYSGTVDIVTGEMRVDMASLTLNTADMDNSDNYPGWKSSGARAIIGSGINGIVTGAFTNISPASLGGGGGVMTNTLGASTDILILNKSYFNKTQTEWIALAIDVQFMLPFATPLTFQLTPQEVMSLVGQNVVWSPDGSVKVRV